MNDAENELLRQAMRMLAKRPRTMTDKAREQRSKAGKNRWKNHKRKGMQTK